MAAVEAATARTGMRGARDVYGHCRLDLEQFKHAGYVSSHYFRRRVRSETGQGKGSLWPWSGTGSLPLHAVFCTLHTHT